MKFLSLFTFFTFFLTPSYAQYNNCERWSFGANFTITSPTDEMQDNNFRTNYGVTFNGLYNLNPQSRIVNLHIGGRMTGGLAIGERDNLLLEDPAGAAARSSIYNTMVDLHVLGRAVLNPNSKIQQYFDFFGGGRLVGANQDIRLNRRVNNYDRKSSESLVQSGNWAWGTGAGILVRLKENAFFDLGVNYTQSETQTFVDMNSVELVNNAVEYELVNSISNSFGVHVGFHFIIECGQEVDRDQRVNRNRNRTRPIFNRNKKKPRAKSKSSGSVKN